MIFRNTAIKVFSSALSATCPNRLLVPGNTNNITGFLADNTTNFVALSGHPTEITLSGSNTGLFSYTLPSTLTDSSALMVWFTSSTSGVFCDPIFVPIETNYGTDITVMFPVWNTTTQGTLKTNDANNITVQLATANTFTTLSGHPTEITLSGAATGFYRQTISKISTSADTFWLWPYSSSVNTKIDPINVVTEEIISLPSNGEVWEGAGIYGRQTLPVTPTRIDALSASYLTTGEPYGDPSNLIYGSAEATVVTSGTSIPTDNCQTLFGYVYKLTRLPVTVANIIVHVKELNTIVNNTLITSRDSNITTTTGYFEINLIQGAEVEVIIKDQGSVLYQNTITVTADLTKDLSTYPLQ